MTSNDELRALAEAARDNYKNGYDCEGNDVCGLNDCPLIVFQEAASPERVIALLDEIRDATSHVACMRIATHNSELLAENERLNALLRDLAPTIAFAMSHTWKPEDFAEYRRLTAALADAAPGAAE